MNELTLTTPTLLFSAVSLILLAYTNRFLSYAQLVRTLKEQYVKEHSEVTAAQIANLRKRLYLTRNMQVLGISSLFFCVITMFLIHVSDLHRAACLIGLHLRLCPPAAHRLAGTFHLGNPYLGQGPGNPSSEHGGIAYWESGIAYHIEKNVEKPFDET